MQEKLQKLLEQAYELCEDGNYVRALEYYDMALDIEPDNLNVMVDKGVTLQNLGRFNEALQMYEKALLKYLKYVKVSEKKLTRVENWFQRYGDKAVLFGRMVPVFREMISIPAGLLKMKFAKFLTYTVLGSCGWSITLIFIGYYFGNAAFEFW